MPPADCMLDGETSASHFKHKFFCLYCNRPGFERSQREVHPIKPSFRWGAVEYPMATDARCVQQ